MSGGAHPRAAVNNVTFTVTGISIVPASSTAGYINFSSGITFSGGADGVFIVLTPGTLMQSTAPHVLFAGGALAKNIFWQVAGRVLVGTGAMMQGILLVKTYVVFGSRSSLAGCVLAPTFCDLRMATITQPLALWSRLH